MSRGPVELSPVADRFRLTQGRLSFAADRGDVHRLTLSLSIPIKETRAPSGERSGTVAPTGDEAKERALNGLERFKYFETQQKILDSLRDAPLR